MEDSRLLVAIHGTQFSPPKWKITIAANLRLVDENMEGAVHRLEHVLVLIDLDRRVHVLLVEVPVARGFPELKICNVGSVDEFIPTLDVLSTPEILDLLANNGSLGMPENQSSAGLLLNAVEVQLLPQLAMVALGSLFPSRDKTDQLFLRWESRTIDALKHLVLLVPSPIRSCDRQKLKMLKVACGRDMRSTAEVRERALSVERDGRRRYLRKDLDLILVAAFLEEFDGLGYRLVLSAEMFAALGDLVHLLLDYSEIIGGQRLRHVDVVVKTSVDRWSDGKLGVRIELFDRLGHDAVSYTHLRAHETRHDLVCRLLLEK